MSQYELNPGRLLMDAVLAFNSEVCNTLFSYIEKDVHTLLEVGAGTGKNAMGIVLRRPSIIATLIDIDPDAARYQVNLLRIVESVINSRLPVVPTIGDFFKNIYHDGQFDIVMSEGVVEHWSDERRQKMIDEMARISRNTVIILTTNGDSPKAVAKALSHTAEYVGVEEYETPYTIIELKERMEAAGLKNVTVEKTGDEFYIFGVGTK